MPWRGSIRTRGLVETRGRTVGAARRRHVRTRGDMDLTGSVLHEHQLEIQPASKKGEQKEKEKN